MFSLRNLFTSAVFCAASAITIAGAVQVYRTGLPESAAKSRATLIDTLATIDVASLSLDEQRAMARRLEQEAQEGVDWRNQFAELESPARTRLTENASLLLRVWIGDVVDEYYDLRPRRRDQFLDEKIDVLTSWPIVHEAVVAGESPQAEPDELGALRQLADNIRDWLDSTDPAEQRRMREFALALQMRWLARSSGRLIGGPAEQ